MRERHNFEIWVERNREEAKTKTKEMFEMNCKIGLGIYKIRVLISREGIE